MSKRKKASGQRSTAGARLQSRPVRPIRSTRRAILLLCGVSTGVALVAAGALMLPATGRRDGVVASLRSERLRVPKQVAALFAGIPQHGAVLGQPTAPVTLQVFADLEDHGDGLTWLHSMLPAILEELVRPGLLRLEFHSMKTDTLNGGPFITQQAAALAAGAQNRLWNYVATFMNEQGEEFTNYATEAFDTGIAQQVPGLDMAEWERSRSVAMSKVVMSDNYDARHQFGLYATPAFRIGLTGGRMKNFTEGTLLSTPKYIVRTKSSGERYIAGEKPELQRPVHLVRASDLKKAVVELLCRGRDRLCSTHTAKR
jgi:protein-disulfide isomerase